MGLASFLKMYLHLIKQLLADHWLVDSLEQLASVLEVTVVERVREDIGNSRWVDALSGAGSDPALRQKVRNVLQSLITFGIQLKGSFDNSSMSFVNMDGFGARVIQISDWSKGRVLASSNFLSETTFRVLGKRVYIVFALAKGQIEHEFALGGGFEPEGGKFE